MADDLAKYLNPTAPPPGGLSEIMRQNFANGGGAQMKSHAEPWYRRLPNALTDAIYGPNANAMLAAGAAGGAADSDAAPDVHPDHPDRDTSGRFISPQ